MSLWNNEKINQKAVTFSECFKLLGYFFHFIIKIISILTNKDLEKPTKH